MNHDQRGVLWTASASHGLIHVYELAVPALLIRIQASFGAGDFTMGRVVALYSLLFGLGALPAGWLADRLGSRVPLLVCLWGASLSLFGMAVSPSLAWFSASAACMGLCLSVYHPAGTALITHAMLPTGRVLAIHGMAGNFGVAAAGALAGSLGDLVGWRWALSLLAVAGLVLGARAARLAVPAAHEIRGREGGGDWRRFALLLLAVTFTGMVYRGITTFLPKLFAASYGREGSGSTTVGGVLTTAALLVGLAGMYAAGRRIDAGTRPALVFVAGAAVQLPLLVAIAWVNGMFLLPLFMAIAFFHFLTQPPGNQLVARLTPPRLRGLGYGLYFFLSFGVGSLGAVLGGWISERFGLVHAFPILALALVPAIAAMIVLARAMPRSQPVVEHAPPVG